MSVATRRKTNPSIPDFDREVVRAAVKQPMMSESRVDTPISMDRREFSVDEREQDYVEEPKPGTPWGFYLVLAAIVVVAIMYSVSIIVLNIDGNVSGKAVFGAMAACFTVIGTLVGTYFGVKAGLDGQEKVRQTLHRATDRSRQRPSDAADANRGRREPSDDQQGATRQHRDQRRGDQGDRQEWTGRGV